MKIILLAGLPGSGKTHYRLEHLSHLPYLDMAELRNQVDGDGYQGWKERMHLLFNQLYNELELGTAEIVVEGIFEPDTASVKWLESYCQDRGIQIETVRISTPFIVVLGNLIKDYESDNDLERLVSRVYLAAKYQGNFK